MQALKKPGVACFSFVFFYCVHTAKLIRHNQKQRDTWKYDYDAFKLLYSLHLLLKVFLIHNCFSGFFQNTVLDLKERNGEKNTGDDGVVSVAFELKGRAEGAEVDHP